VTAVLTDLLKDAKPCCEYHDGFAEGVKWATEELDRLRVIETAARECLASRKALPIRLTDLADAMGKLEQPH
jgi:hypothetical protein